MESGNKEPVPVMKESQIKSSLASDGSLETLLSRLKPVRADIQEAWLSQPYQRESEVDLQKFSQQNQAQTSTSLVNSTNNWHPHVEFSANIGMPSQEFAAQRMDNCSSHWNYKAHQETINMSASSYDDSCSFSQSQASYQCQTNVPNQCPGVQGLHYNDPLVQWNKLSFKDLLSMKEMSATSMMAQDGKDSTFISDLNCQPQDETLNASSASTQRSSATCMQEMQSGGFPRQLWTCDLNSPLSSEHILTNGGRQVPLAAASPCQRTEENIVAKDKSLCMDSSSNQQNEKAENQVAASRVYELEKLDADSSSIMIENHPNMGCSNIDLNKTPQQKSRRKKHRPKVVSENKTKRTPKPKVPQPTNSGGTPKPKRKYARKNETNPSLTTPSAAISPAEAVDPKDAVKSCRRDLNVNWDDHEMINGSQTSSKVTPKPKRKYKRKNETNPQSTPPSAEISLAEAVDQEESVSAIKSCRRGLNFDLDDHEKIKGSQTSSKVTPKPKRRYKRKNDTSSTPPSAEISLPETVDQEESVSAVKSCRRGLKFDLGDHEKIKGSQKNKTKSAGLESVPAVHHTHEDKLTAGSADNLSHKVDQMLNNCTTVPEIGELSSVSEEQVKVNAICESQENGNWQAGAATSIQENGVSTMLSMTFPQALSPNYGACAHSEEGEAMKELKTAYSCILDEVHVKAKNLNSTTDSTFCQSSPIHLQNSIIFSGNHKKKRPEKVQKPITLRATSSASVSEASRQTNSAQDGPSADVSTAKYYQYCIPPQLTTHATAYHQADAVVQTRMTDKNSDKSKAQLRNLTALTGFAADKELPAQAKPKNKYNHRKKVSHLNSIPSSMEALGEDSSMTHATKKKTRKRNFTLSLDKSSIHATNFQKNLVRYEDFQSVQNYGGAVFGAGHYLALPWKDPIEIDAITDALEQLDISRENSETQGQNAIVLHCTNNQAQNALVLYKKNDTLVTFEGKPIRKKRPRARVYLDDETDRVWRLLLENINSEGIDGTNEEKAKWWANERRVFGGRVDSFIARMRLVQGDRRFTPWKGSVVDSVVGVFLTQNVSDHLSSSAFMSMVARFPLKSQGEIRTYSRGNIILVEEPTEPDNAVTWIGKTSDEPVCDRISRTLHDIDHVEEKEVVDSKELLSAVSLNDHSCSNKCASGSGQKTHNEWITSGANRNHVETETACTSEDAKAIDDIASSQHSVGSSQNFAESQTAPTAGRISSCSDSNSEQEDLLASSSTNPLYFPSSFVELLKMAENCTLHEAFLRDAPSYLMDNQIQADEKQHKQEPKQNADCVQMLDRESISSDDLSRKDQNYTTEQSDLTTESMIQFPSYDRTPDSNQRPSSYAENTCSSYVFEGEKIVIESQRQSTKQDHPDLPSAYNNDCMTENISVPDKQKSNMHTFSQPCLEKSHASAESPIILNQKATKQKKGTSRKDEKTAFDWDSLRKKAQAAGGVRGRAANTMDSVDWEAVRHADVSEIAETIKERGMNNKLAERIKDFLDRLVREHGSIDLEWLRDVPPDRAKDYLLSIRGLGLKSVECVRLLTLHHLAFPVDTNVGRIAVRLGWVPLQPLPESLQLHLLELYPVLESIQKYLWPRLCKLDQRTLYELHYHMITFGKVFCTKRQPNCNACPLRGECRHFASAFASARLGLPGPEERSIMTSTKGTIAHHQPQMTINPLPLPASEENLQLEAEPAFRTCEPIIEVPASPEPEQAHNLEYDIEDAIFEDSEIPTIKLNLEQFTQTLQDFMHGNMELQEADMSKALVALTAEAAAIPTLKLKNVSRLRTEHHVYELPDDHPLLEGLDKREPDDPCSYLLAIWTPGETANSIQPPEKRCTSEGPGELCEDATCFYCNSQREASSQIVRGTLLIPCRTAMRGSFPLNGTYFQVNEVFADHNSSLIPLSVPRGLIWNLPRKTVYFGSSVPTIFRGLTTEGIQHCFWRGYVCVRGFDQKTRAPRPLMARLHCPASKMTKTGGKSSQGYE